MPRLLALTAAAALSCATVPEDPGVRHHFSVATYNVNYGLAGDPETIRTASDIDADVIFFQEVTPEWEVLLFDALSDTYPHSATLPAGGAAGFAVFSRYPLRDGGTIAGLDGWFPAWRVDVDTPLGWVQTVNVHLRPPLGPALYLKNGRTHRAEWARFEPLLDPTLPTLIVGDFNEGRGGAVRELKRAGYIDALREYHPRANTWGWEGTPLTGMLDHVMVGPGLRAIDAEVLQGGRSDHQPVVATVVRAAPGS